MNIINVAGPSGKQPQHIFYILSVPLVFRELVIDTTNDRIWLYISELLMKYIWAFWISLMSCFSFCKKPKRCLSFTHLLSSALTSRSGFLSWPTLLVSRWASRDAPLSPWRLQSGPSGERPCGRSAPGLWCCWLYLRPRPEGVGLSEKYWLSEKPWWGRSVGWRT